jgi:hypothetical protein
MLLPFLLVFAIVFAVLQKAEIFGKEKKQTDAIIAVVVALLVVSVGYATNVIINLMPILAVGLVILLVFFLLWGFAFREKEFNVHKNVQWVIAGLAAITVVIAVLYFTPAWDYLRNMMSGQGSNVITNVVFVVLIIAAVVAVIFGGKKEEGK